MADQQAELVPLTAIVVSAFVSNNRVSVTELPRLIETTFSALEAKRRIKTGAAINEEGLEIELVRETVKHDVRSKRRTPSTQASPFTGSTDEPDGGDQPVSQVLFEAGFNRPPPDEAATLFTLTIHDVEQGLEQASQLCDFEYQKVSPREGLGSVDGLWRFPTTFKGMVPAWTNVVGQPGSPRRALVVSIAGSQWQFYLIESEVFPHEMGRERCLAGLMLAAGKKLAEAEIMEALGVLAVNQGIWRHRTVRQRFADYYGLRLRHVRNGGIDQFAASVAMELRRYDEQFL